MVSTPVEILGRRGEPRAASCRRTAHVDRVRHLEIGWHPREDVPEFFSRCLGHGARDRGPCTIRLSGHLDYSPNVCGHRALPRPYELQSSRDNSGNILVHVRTEFGVGDAVDIRRSATCSRRGARRGRHFRLQSKISAGLQSDRFVDTRLSRPYGPQTSQKKIRGGPDARVNRHHTGTSSRRSCLSVGSAHPSPSAPLIPFCWLFARLFARPSSASPPPPPSPFLSGSTPWAVS
jgi:hypothetical protein